MNPWRWCLTRSDSGFQQLLVPTRTGVNTRKKLSEYYSVGSILGFDGRIVPGVPQLNIAASMRSLGLGMSNTGMTMKYNKMRRKI
ncbi:MAG: hypothetical protein QOE88_45 [Verrucomicrobiota bacterium]|nr:hypothetical protein [Verrucomicrobiota bacterium]